MAEPPWASLLRGIWDPPGSEIEPVSPALGRKILYHGATGEAPGIFNDVWLSHTFRAVQEVEKKWEKIAHNPTIHWYSYFLPLLLYAILQEPRAGVERGVSALRGHIWTILIIFIHNEWVRTGTKPVKEV